MLVLIASLIVAVFGAGMPTGPHVIDRTVAPSEEAKAGVTDLLRRRAEAIRARDRAGFAATLDPKAAPEFRDAQLALFANLAAVPLASWEYLFDAADPSDVPRSQVDRSADEVWAPRTELRYALAGADLEVTGRPAGYLYLRRGDSWYLASDTALDEVGRPTWRGVWDFGPCHVARAEHGLVIGHPASAPLIDLLAKELDGSVAAVTAVWGPGWPGRVAVLVPGGPAELRALLGPRDPADSIAAITLADRVDRAAGKAWGQRVVINPGQSVQLGPTAVRVVLRHEITHVAAQVATDDRAPLWLKEGFAEYVGYLDSGLAIAEAAPALLEQARREQLPDYPPPDGAFRGPGLMLAYQQSWSLMRLVGERVGPKGVVGLYRSLAAEPGATAQPRLDQTLRATLGKDLDDLMDDWHDELADEVE
ncbi:hypothetical protein GCM10023321_61120 [Pseudonocardia eucalypti]|uniref:Basic secretory peptidase family protein n=1 Tax=Pseudonocardia eucalypti TaxID=648755 RepID=A0ABP9QUM8_9PSEU|nr:hypothetical protein [Pseudonocardia eucalypti]